MIKRIYAQGGRSRIALLSGSAIDKEEQVLNFLKMVGFITMPKLYSKINGAVRLEGIQELHGWCANINRDATNNFLTTHNIPTNKDTATTHVFDLFISIIKPGTMSIMPRPNYNGRKDVKNGYYRLSQSDDLEYQRAVSALSNAVHYNSETNEIVRDNVGAIAAALVSLQRAKMQIMVRAAIAELSRQPVNERGERLYPKVILYADYLDVVNFLMNELQDFNPVKNIGTGMTEKKRNESIAKFQEMNGNCRLLIGTLKAGGLSINLHDTSGYFPRTMFVMPGYFINETHQATGRIFRDGMIGIAKIRFVYGYSSSGNLENSIQMRSPGKVMLYNRCIQNSQNMG